MKDKITNIKNLYTKENTQKYFKYMQLAVIAIFLWSFIYWKKCYIGYTSDGAIDKNTIYKAIMIIGLAIATAIFVFVKNNLNDKLNGILSYTLFFVSPVISFYTLEYFNKDTFAINISNIWDVYKLMNFVIFGAIVMTIFVITNNIKISIMGLCIFVNLLGVVNYYVYSFRGITIVASDVFSTETAASVAKDYKLFLDSNIFFMIIATLLTITIISKLRSFKVIRTWKLKLPLIFAYIVGLGIFLNIFVVSDQLSEWRINIKLYRPYEAYKKYGSMLSMVRTISYIIVDEPEGYSVKQIEEIADRYSEDEGNGQTPNIIVIMDEAFSDLQTINEFPISEDYMPFIRSLNENTIKGNAYVSVFGGNTANTEFEFLTSNSMALLPANTVPYQLFIKGKFPSIVYSLEQQNYVGNIGLHPYKPNGFNRAQVYPLLGFKQFITLEDFDQSRKLRGKITDEADFDRIIEEYEKSKSQSDKPFFIFNVTMQNHGGYSSDDPNFEQKVLIKDENYYDSNAQNYLSLIKYTDEAVEKLIKYYENVDEPTVIIFFGDHRPGLRQSWYDKLFGKSENELTTEELMEKYVVPFFAWANYDIPEENVDKISMNYLSAYIMDKIGVKLTKYQQYTLDVHKQIPAMNTLGYWGADGKYYTYDDTNSPYYEILNEYRNVQYNNIHDRGDRVDSMFYLE